MTPFEAVYGRPPLIVSRFVLNNISNPTAQDRMKFQSDKGRREVIFDIGVSRIHHVFHVSMLCKCIGKPTNQITPIELLDQTPSVTLTPEAVLKTRDVTKGAHKVPQCLVKWVGLPIEDATWEDSYTLLQQFSHLNLEDKVLLHEGDNVMTPQDKLDNNSHSTRYKRVPQYLDHYVVPDAKGKQILIAKEHE
ncbi:hypothetical protein KY290_036250 [Solanum tuberosum]|uniref:Chromo domain-containing protein n=1 Tax=Solanum tuberosum TaxID=4113 RepID=A0ABQ7TSM3_SOLTU|nr:hypothetical protein KY290_036250 [Solanum tuberosum]